MISATLNLMKFSTAISESGLTCVHKPVKVLAPKGKRTVSSTTSGERGQTTTIVVACSASGVYVPPMMIFKRKRNKPELVDHDMHQQGQSAVVQTVARSIQICF